MRDLLVVALLMGACGDGGPPSFNDRIPDMSEAQRHRYCYSCQDKCFRDFQRVADTLDDWQKDWRKCLLDCSKRYQLDPAVCQMRDKEYIIRRKPRKPPKPAKEDED